MRWLLFFIISSCLAFGETIRGIVIDVTDGDTITVLEKTPKEKVAHKVRLDGIDAPEKGQDGYSGAKYSLKKLLWGETVTVQYTKRDKYERILGLVLYNASFINYEMVKEGWAWHFKKYSNSYELASLEIDARKDKRGLWGEPNPIPPWEWRAGKRGGAAAEKSDKKISYWISSTGKTHLPGCRYYGVGQGSFNELGTADCCKLCWKIPKIKIRQSELTYDPTSEGGRIPTVPSRSYSKPRYEPFLDDVFIPSSSTDSKARTIYTGPRGGRYYINRNGNKTYIKR